MKTLTCVMAHKDAQDTVNRHTDYWITGVPEFNELIFTCPRNSMILSQYPVVALGVASHHDPSAIDRFRKILNFLSTMDYDWFILTEYDAIAFEPMFPGTRDMRVYSNLFTSDQPNFEGHHFTHPPLQFSKKTLTFLALYFNTAPDTIERSFWDRAMGLICERNGIELTGYGCLGYAQNTIEPRHLASAIEARKKGAVWFHGIKDARTLQAIAQAKP